MSFTPVILLIVAALFCGMLLAFEFGRRLGIARLARDPDGVSKGSGSVEGAVLGLLGLLLALTFSGAGSRFEERRFMIADETNAISTAYLRLDLLPAEAQPAIRGLFRQYLDARVAAYRNVSEPDAMQAALTQGSALQDRIWSAAVDAVRLPQTPPQAGMLLLPALNEMIDITTTRAVAFQNHPPRVIYLLLGGVGLACALLLGYASCGTKVRSWFYILLFAATISLTLFVILDLEFPRFGMIRVDAADEALVELGKMMK